MTTDTREAEITYAEPEAGIYPAAFTACEPFSYEDKTTGETELRWRWVFYLDDDTEMDTLTSRSFRPGTNALKLFTGILGRPPVAGDKPADNYGKRVQVVYGPNKGGKLTVTDVHQDRAAAPRVAASIAPVPQPGETLAAAAQPGEFSGAPRTPLVAEKVGDELGF